MGLGVLSLTGYEADDILGTLSSQCAQRDIAALLLTGDRDALQLVSDDTTLLLTRKGISEIEECTPARVQELFGVRPDQISDLKGLMGDSSDNIPPMKSRASLAKRCATTPKRVAFPSIWPPFGAIFPCRYIMMRAKPSIWPTACPCCISTV